ncbi:hypothetical protein HPG69_008179 [Diceros bicornis minor]|uniref:G-protein coupled receptors family 1 profile domain-containing protein n=1 Tax=Diceros bicornis minor TaxID=77932 RepID=A0A7J7E796_DICBM|nr:hypothetical protein HPG69_008179 [Diceros bicornis minor]
MKNTVKTKNQTDVAEFLLLGLTDDPETQPLISCLFVETQLINNMESENQTGVTEFPLQGGSLQGWNIPKQNKSISYTGCHTQVCFILFFAGLENFILAAMAYDCYAAICHPLRSEVITNPGICCPQILLSLIMSIADAHVPWKDDSQSHGRMVTVLLHRPGILLFFCELSHQAACSDTLIKTILVYLVTSMLGGVPLFGISFSYIQIVSSTLRMPSTRGNIKPHLPIDLISPFLCHTFGVFINSAVNHSSKKTEIASAMYTAVLPILNPFIYSLMSKDMKGAVGRLI